MNKPLKYKRVLLKLSGQLFGKKEANSIDFNAFNEISKKLIDIWKETGIDLCIVLGGGNIFRGRDRYKNVDEVTADYMGMLATIINGLALQEAFERNNAETRMMTAFPVTAVAEPYIRRRALSHLEKRRIVILAAGVGSPFFTTDSGAALRAAEIGCDVLLKATNVDGIFSADPKTDENAKMLRTVSYEEAIKSNLGVMDTTAFALAMKKQLPIAVFNIEKLDEMIKIVRGEEFSGTLVK